MWYLTEYIATRFFLATEVSLHHGHTWIQAGRDCDQTKIFCFDTPDPRFWTESQRRRWPWPCHFRFSWLGHFHLGWNSLRNCSEIRGSEGLFMFCFWRALYLSTYAIVTQNEVPWTLGGELRKITALHLSNMVSGIKPKCSLWHFLK